MKLDTVDLKIIEALLEDARTPFSTIAKNLDIPVSTMHSRFMRMTSEGLIKGFTVYLDPHTKQEEMIGLSLRIKAVSSRIEEARNFVINLPNNSAIKHVLIPYTWICVGWYNMGAYIYASTTIDISTIHQLLMRHPAIVDVKIAADVCEHWLFKKTFLEQLSRIAKING